ncbi:zinc-binding dehydrogenase [Rhodococcus sp. NPDC058639]|uniref:zinc-binding dehydrogenase n=1 Tax=Rhodococcus sp. NPDC058639 TaxID=3346570 RepID=UPI00365FB4E8
MVIDYRTQDLRSPRSGVRERGRSEPHRAPGHRRSQSHTRPLARKLGVTYEFLFMHTSGEQLRLIADLVDAGSIRPVVGATFAIDQTPEALASLGKSSIRGKSVNTVPDLASRGHEGTQPHRRRWEIRRSCGRRSRPALHAEIPAYKAAVRET